MTTTNSGCGAAIKMSCTRPAFHVGEHRHETVTRISEEFARLEARLASYEAVIAAARRALGFMGSARAPCCRICVYPVEDAASLGPPPCDD